MALPSLQPQVSRPWFRRAAWFLSFLIVLAALFGPRPARAQQAVHIVARGEHLSGIAASYGVDLGTLISYNGITNPSIVYVGQRLVIPGGSAGQSAPSSSGGVYTVRRGDTMSQIAQRFGMTTAQLMSLNGLRNASFVWVGQRLRVSGSPVAVSDASANVGSGSTYVVQRGDTLSVIAQRYNTSVAALMSANGLASSRVIWVGQRLRLTPGASADSAVPAASDGRRWIDVNLSSQTLTAWQGNTAVMYTNISSGVAGTPTITGHFTIGRKYQSQTMVGADYRIPNVPWVMYFYGGYAIHGTYWHNMFGTPMSHGCVNMRVGEAQTLFNWASAGTEVVVHY